MTTVPATDNSNNRALPQFWQAYLNTPMSRVQKLSVATLIAMCAIDGFDIFAITFSAPALEAELRLTKAAIGVVFSAALVGMALGSLLLSPLADRYGRRAMLIVSLTMMIIGTLWTAMSFGMIDLIASRLLTGLGVGTMVAVITPLASEYSNEARRDLSVTLMGLGYPVGAILGGLLAAWMIPALGWRAVFFTGAGLGALMLLIVLLWLPEPIAGILLNRDPRTLARLNQFLRRCGQPMVGALPPEGPNQRRRGSLGRVFTREELPHTLSSAAIFFLLTLSVYYIQTWIPSLVVSAGHNISTAAMVSTTMSAGGVVGGTTIALLAPRFGLKAVVVFAIGLTCAAICLFGVVPPRIELLVAMAAIVGFGTIGGVSNFYALLSRNFPADARATGVGFVIGTGRFGSAIGPALGGMLFSLGYQRDEVSLMMALPAFAAAVMLLMRKLRDFA